MQAGIARRVSHSLHNDTADRLVGGPLCFVWIDNASTEDR